MNKHNYWFELISGLTWSSFKKKDKKVFKFRSSRRKLIQKIKKSDYFLYCFTILFSLFGNHGVVSEQNHVISIIWSDEESPYQQKIKLIIKLSLYIAISVHEFIRILSYFQSLKKLFAWTGAFGGSPTKWTVSGRLTANCTQGFLRNQEEFS